MKLKFLLAPALLLISLTAIAQSHCDEIGIQTDNDSYLGQGSDRYYTDGIFIYFRHALKIKDKDTVRLYNKVLGLEAGQKIFNPHSGTIANYAGVDLPRLIDRPFAAYLYIGATLNLLYKNESNLRLSAQFGVVGPDAFGRQVQSFVHKTFGFYHPSGWEYQINNNFELNLSAEYNRLLARASWIDLSFASYGNLGNGFTGAGLGPLIRAYHFNQLFHSVSTQSTAVVNDKTADLHKHEFFIYYKPQINYVAYDATIQGGLFTSRSPTSIEVTKDKEPFILSQQVGIAYSSRRFIVDAGAIFHTLDDKEMRQTHQWGTVSVFYRFN